MRPIIGDHYQTQGYGRTEFARSSTGLRLYKAFGGVHPGLDFGTKGVNLEIVATCDGTVVRAGIDGGWGNHVELKGDDGWNRQYAHLSAVSTKVGAKVVAGTVLGRVGNTGSSTATHLHYGHRRRKLTGGWEYRDPSVDLMEIPEPVVLPKGRVIKGAKNPDIYVWTGRMKHRIPDWETYVFLFGKEQFEEVDDGVVSKLPEGQPMVSLR